MNFECELDGKTINESNADWQFIECFLNQMTPMGKSFCILTSNNDNYVQCAGAKSKMVVEYRKYEGVKFKHFVLGIKPQGSKDISVRYSGGYISVKKNEILSCKHVAYIFKAFFETKVIPDDYCLRETTEMFL